MKKLAEFLSLPIVCLFTGLLLFLLIGCAIWNLDASGEFCSYSAWLGAGTVIALNIFDYGWVLLTNKKKD